MASKRERLAEGEPALSREAAPIPDAEQAPRPPISVGAARLGAAI
jgi:hypothetical protein